MASWAERDGERSGYPSPPRFQDSIGFDVVLSPLSSCNRKKHFSLLCPHPLPSSQMCEMCTSGLKPIMSISFIFLDISCTRTSRFLSALNEYFNVTIQVVQLFLGLFSYMSSVAKCSTAWLSSTRSFSGLFPAWLLGLSLIHSSSQS